MTSLAERLAAGDLTALDELDALHAAVGSIAWGATTEEDCLTGCGVDLADEWHPWCLYDTGEDDPPLAAHMMRPHAEWFALLANTWPALRDRLRTLEAEVDRLNGFIEMQGKAGLLLQEKLHTAEARALHAEADALENRETIECVVEALCVALGWEEIDGDGDEASLIVAAVETLAAHAAAVTERETP